MKIMWLVNFIPPAMGKKLGLPVIAKEGWVTGLMRSLMEMGKGNELAIVTSVPGYLKTGFLGKEDGVSLYGFHESVEPHVYLEENEKILSGFVTDYVPDIIHIFGTEFGHTRAMVEGLAKYGEDKLPGISSRVLIGFQGICAECAGHFLDGVPARVVRRHTFRDILKGDTLKLQKYKFVLRSVNEARALSTVMNITGRTPFDKAFSEKTAPFARYHHLNETLRPSFYESVWDEKNTEPHSIFLSQADYPIKGAHYMLEALPIIYEKYPDVSLYIGGNNITKHRTFKEKLKLSSYGKYLLELEKQVNRKTGGKVKITYLGMMDEEAMRERYLKSSLFVCPSTVENSPNSLGEAMLLGMPVIGARVGGIPGMLEDGKEGILYEAGNIGELVASVDKMWSDSALRSKMAIAARERALKTHDPESNFKRVMEIYETIRGESHE